MDGHAGPRHGLNYEEKSGLLDEKPLPDIESGAGRAGLEFGFPSRRPRQWTLQQAQRAVTTFRSGLLRAAIFVLPSFVQSRLFHDPRSRAAATTTTRRLSPTAYLDGMRGLAAFFVFFCHYFYTCFVIAPGYGYAGANYDLLKLPFLRLFFSGPPMVCVFFVISGYALSLKPLKLVHAHSRNKTKGKSNDLASFATTLSSLTFRRGVRLFLPPALSTLLVALLVRLGLYEWTREFAHDARYMRNIQELHYGDGLAGASQTGRLLAEWAGAVFRFVHVWDWELFGGSMTMDLHLWTIPVEFRCSMVLFLTLVATARLKTAVRLGVVAGLGWFVYRSQRWDMLLFYAGMVLAEVDVTRGAHHASNGSGLALPVADAGPGAGAAGQPGLMSASASRSSSRSRSPSPSPSLSAAAGARRWRHTIRRALWGAVSVVGLYLMSQPDEGGAETPGWVYLTSVIPEWWKDEHRYWQSLGAVLFVLAVGRSSGWRRLFNLDAVQYLGKISYAIYLMHGPVLHTVGYAIERWAWGLTGVEGGAYLAGFVLAAVFVVPIVIWVSDVFWRAVDAPIVRLAKWLERVCSVPE